MKKKIPLSRSKVAKNGDEITIRSKWGDYVATVVTGNAQTAVSLIPTAVCDARVDAMQDIYRLYRFERIAITFYSVAAGEMGYVGFIPGTITGGNPTLAETLLTLEKHAVYYPIMVKPATLVLTRNDLSGAIPWYYTDGAAAEQFEQAGTLVLSTAPDTTFLATASHLVVHYDVTITLKDPISSGMSVPRPPRIKCQETKDECEDYTQVGSGIELSSTELLKNNRSSKKRG
jgi:hypothetical protein